MSSSGWQRSRSLPKKPFFGHVPFPVINLDTAKKIPKIYTFRDSYPGKWKLDLVIVRCPPIEMIDPRLPPASRSAARKTTALNDPHPAEVACRKSPVMNLNFADGL